MLFTKPSAELFLTLTAPHNHFIALIQFLWKRGSTWRERVMRMRMRITLILYNFPESSTFCDFFTTKFRSVYVDCQRLQEIVQDSAKNFYSIESCQPSCLNKNRRKKASSICLNTVYFSKDLIQK